MDTLPTFKVHKKVSYVYSLSRYHSTQSPSRLSTCSPVHAGTLHSYIATVQYLTAIMLLLMPVLFLLIRDLSHLAKSFPRSSQVILKLQYLHL